ncbi:sensor histidine kinase [Bordetella tumulicola]|uniref:sensor histidine kinase n=1 Tax=Bordetella tumulicola TaxID=1649133 RepID=UPI0039EE4AF3
MSRVPTQNSLRWRLLLGMLITVLIAWVILLTWVQRDRTRERTGEWDISLQRAGFTALESLPQGLEDVALPRGYRLASPAPSVENDANLEIQVYSLANGRLLLHSPNSPSQPFIASYQDGFATSMINGESWRTYAVSDADGLIQVQVGKSLAALQQELSHRMQNAFLFLAALFLPLAAVAWAITYVAFTPVLRLSTLLRRRHPLDLDPLATQDLPDEIKPLVESFNQQLSRVEAAVENERRFLQDAAHELRTPLAVLSLQAENALRSQDLDEIHHSVRQINLATQRSARIAEQLLDMARLESTGLNEAATRIDLASVAHTVVKDYRQRVASRSQTLTEDLQPGFVLGHLDTLGILLRNLLDNATRYGDIGGNIRVVCGPDPMPGYVRLAVQDDGPGVPQEYRHRILDRFYRMPRATGHGSGIGLSLVARIARLHGADLEVGPGIEGKGLGVTLRLAAAKRNI